jgi:hypothetical protein
MALNRRKDEETSESGLMVAIETFSTDLRSGEPVTVRRGETFAPTHELVERLGIWFATAGTSSWEREAILQRRLSSKARYSRTPTCSLRPGH